MGFIYFEKGELNEKYTFENLMKMYNDFMFDLFHYGGSDNPMNILIESIKEKSETLGVIMNDVNLTKDNIEEIKRHKRPNERDDILKQELKWLNELDNKIAHRHLFEWG